MSATQRIWEQDFSNVTEGLAPSVRTVDGFDYIDETTAPAGLVSAYRALTRVGYANGWLGS